MAVTWGTPTPATTRVVQIDPGPTPTFTPSAPASIMAWAPGRVATLPPITSSRVLALIWATMASTASAWTWAVPAMEQQIKCSAYDKGRHQSRRHPGCHNLPHADHRNAPEHRL